MAIVKVRVTVEAVQSLQSEDWRDEYLEWCEEEGHEPDTDVPTQFVLERYTRDVEDGSLSFDEIFGDGTEIVSVELA